GRVDPPSHVAPAIPPEVDALTMRGLSADPDARFASAREMARELERVVPVASASVIGEWVDALMHDSLVDRARRVELAEESSRSVKPARDSSRAEADSESRIVALDGDATRSLPAKPIDLEAPTDPDAMPTQLSSTQPSERHKSSRKRTWSWVL